MAKAVKSRAKKNKIAAAKKGGAIAANAMDYNEHEKTYALFLDVCKWTIAANVALLVAMAVGFYVVTGWAGLPLGALVFIVLMIVFGYFI